MLLDRAPRASRLAGAAFASALFFAAAPATAQERFACPGTSVSFFEEREAAGWVGFGETWDHETCAQGRAFYAEGAREWSAMRPQWSRLAASKINAEFYANVFPLMFFGALASIVVIAWVMAFFGRRRRVRVATLSCPSCATDLPITLDDSALRNLFCPACGEACVLVDTGARRAAGGTA
jgi:hypothetical protein